MTETPSAYLRKEALVRTLLDTLARADGPLRAGEVLDQVARELPFNAFEASTTQSGSVRGKTFLSWEATGFSTIGWMVKQDGHWQITQAGRDALAAESDESLYDRVERLYKEITREGTPDTSAERLGRLRRLMELVPEGSWTAFQDLGEAVGTNGGAIGQYLFRHPMPNAHRVLDITGRPVSLTTNDSANHGAMHDPVPRLLEEGVEFVGGRAAERQRISGQEFRVMLTDSGETLDVVSRRAWLVRGSNVNGVDLVAIWLERASCSVAASQLRPIDPPMTRRDIAAIVEDDYAHVSYNARNEKTAEFDAFLNRMQTGDLIVTTSGAEVFVGTIVGDAAYVKSADDRSNLRREVAWANPKAAIDFADLPAALKARLSSQHTVVDLTNDLASVEQLLERGDTPDPSPTKAQPPVASLREATNELAEQLLVDRAWIQEVIDLLRDRRQLIFYGPPGTGKTFLAQKIAEHITDREAVKLVQFHPAYSYEDFFEGFRPSLGDGGSVGFELAPGPFRRLVDAARENPGAAYVLIIDEINRANLAKVFGELYFLLEYRDQAVDLLYSSGDGFTLPGNVYLIGTMNTADRSIALVDAAMRRRFAFLALHPGEEPTAGLLRRWLRAQRLPETSADLLETLNRLIEDDDFKIGPSYFMRPSVHIDGGLERAWRTAILPLLEEHHYGDEVDVAKRYSLQRLLNRISQADELDAPPGQASLATPSPEDAGEA